MNLDQQRALALAQARRRRAEAETAGAERPDGMAVFNEGIARGLGTPVDLITGAINAGISGVNTVTGSQHGHITSPIGGSDNMRDIFEAIGVRMPDDDYEPEGVMENLILGTGSAAGGIVPFAGVGKAMQAGTGLTKAAGDAMLQPFTSTPVRAVASELAAGAGAGVGVDVAEEIAPDNPLAQMAGAVVGGVAGGMGPYAIAKGATKLPGVAAATRLAQAEIAPFTEAGAMERARNRITNLVEDPEAARAAMAQPTRGGLSPAVSTGDKRLMALEQQVRDTDPAVDLRMRQQEAQGADALRQEIVAPANGQNSGVARTFMEDSVRQQVDGVGQALDDTFGAPAPNATAMGDLQRSSQPARSAAYDAAYDAEVNLYASEAGRELETLIARVQATAPGAFKRANQLMAGAGYESNQMLLQEAADGSVSIMRLPDTRQLDFLTRSLRDMANSTDGRGAFGGQNTYGSTLSALSKSIRDNVRVANPAYGNALDTAATVFGQRDALRFGANMLNPSIPRDVVAGEVADMTEAELGYVRQAVRAQLDEQLANVRMTISNPDTGLREAQSAMQRLSSRAVREKIGMLFPDEQAQVLFGRMDEATAMLDPRSSGVATFAAGRPGEEIKALLNAPDPGAAAAQLVTQASTDASGNALSGVKASFLDELMARARTGTYDDAGEALLSGRAMQSALNDTRMSAVGNAILSPEDRSRLDAIVGELTKLETARSRLPGVGAVMEGEPNSIVSMIARTIAARTGAHAGRGTSGASLLTAHFASERMRKLLETLTLDRAEALVRQAVAGDRELFQLLLTPSERVTPRQEGYLANILSQRGPGTAAGTAAGGVAAMEEPEDPYAGDELMRIVMGGNEPRPPLRVVVDGAGSYGDDVLDAIMR